MKKNYFYFFIITFLLSGCTFPLIEELNRSVEDKVKKYMKKETFEITEVHEIIEERDDWSSPFTVVRDTFYNIKGSFFFETDGERERYDPVTFTDDLGKEHVVKWELYDESADDDHPRLFFHKDVMLGIWEECPFEVTEVYSNHDGLNVDEFGEAFLELSQDGVEYRFSRRSLFIKLKLIEE